MLNSKLGIYVWGPPSSATRYQDVSALLENLSFSSVAPGGFGSLSGLVRINKPQIPRPQFGLFSRIAIISRGKVVWLGELMNPAYGVTQQDGDYIKLSALGIGNGMRDIPSTFAFSGQTPQAIMQTMLADHVTTLKSLASVLSTDNSQLFPDNPAATLTVVYDERTFEEISSDIALQAGDYNWGVEADPKQVDALGFPLGRVYVRARDLATKDYSATVAQRDIVQGEFTPTANRAYNHIQIDYANGTSGVGRARATDPRINVDFSQGSAPFRLRKYLRDLSGISTVNATVATSIANTYLGLFENITYTGTITLRTLRDGAGNPIPLWEAQAGKNIYLPDLAIAGQQLPAAATQNVNLFWITQASYHEDASGAQYLDLTLGYLPETPDVRIARLQMVSDALARSGKVTNIVQALGAGLQGYYGFDFSNALGGATVGVGVTWRALASNAPTSVTLTSISTVNVSGLAASAINAHGCHISGSVTAGGAGNAIGTYVTAGNCLRHVDGSADGGGRFAHHCDGCDTLHTDRSIAEHLRVGRRYGETPGLVALSVECPTPGCGRIESYNTALTADDERDELAGRARAEQARLIRAAMVAAGLALA